MRSGCRRPRCDSVRPARPSRTPQVWRAQNGELTAVPVTAGLTDGQFSEIVDGELAEGDTVAVRQSTPEQSVRPAATGSPFQFMQPQGPPMRRGERAETGTEVRRKRFNTGPRRHGDARRQTL